MVKTAVFLVLAALFLTIGPHSSRAETITIVADEWCPYNCDPDSDRPGYMVEMAIAAFGRHGIGVDYKIMPWSRAIEDARNGKYDGLVGAYPNEAPDFIYPKQPQGRCKFAFFTRQDDSWTFSGIDSLTDRTLGVVNDYSYSTPLDNYVEANQSMPKRVQKTSGISALETNMLKLMMGRIDTLVEDRQVITYRLSTRPDTERPDLRDAGTLPDESDLNGAIFVAFSPANPNAERYAKILDEETQAMQKDGRLAEILARYGLQDIEGSKLP